jgi:hypothetical protein
MSIVLESPVEVKAIPSERTEERTARKQDSDQKESPVVNKHKTLIEDAISTIKHHQRGIGKATFETIVHLCGIGDELNDLHVQVGHGKWEALVEQEVGLDKTTVQRLRTIAKSELRNQIPTLGLDLKAKLPSDIQKLVLLAKFKDDNNGIHEFLGRFNPSTMNRDDLRVAVYEAIGEPKDSKSQKGQSKSRESKQSKVSAIKQLFSICEKSMSSLTTSVEEQLGRGKLKRESLERAAAAIENAQACLDKLQLALKERLAS